MEGEVAPFCLTNALKYIKATGSLTIILNSTETLNLEGDGRSDMVTMFQYGRQA